MNPKFQEQIKHNHQNLINLESSEFDYTDGFKLNVHNDMSNFFLDKIKQNQSLTGLNLNFNINDQNDFVKNAKFSQNA